jgi:hypothetical protein
MRIEQADTCTGDDPSASKSMKVANFKKTANPADISKTHCDGHSLTVAVTIFRKQG